MEEAASSAESGPDALPLLRYPADTHTQKHNHNHYVPMHLRTHVLEFKCRHARWDAS